MNARNVYERYEQPEEPLEIPPEPQENVYYTRPGGGIRNVIILQNQEVDPKENENNEQERDRQIIAPRPVEEAEARESDNGKINSFPASHHFPHVALRSKSYFHKLPPLSHYKSKTDSYVNLERPPKKIKQDNVRYHRPLVIFPHPSVYSDDYKENGRTNQKITERVPEPQPGLLYDYEVTDVMHHAQPSQQNTKSAKYVPEIPEHPERYLIMHPEYAADELRTEQSRYKSYYTKRLQ